MDNVSKEKGEKFESIVEKIYIQLFNQFTSDLNKWPYHFWNLDVADIEMYIR